MGEPFRRHWQRMGIPENRLFFSPYAVDTELFEEQYLRTSREQVRKELGIRDHELVILFCGKLIPIKAPELLLEALSKIPNRERLFLLIVGDGALREVVETRGRLLLGDRFLMAGFVNQSMIGKYYRAADVLVLPSRYETWGLVVNEAMQFGLPAIVSSAVGCRYDLVRDGETGFVFQAGDARSLAERFVWCLEAPDHLREMGRRARERIAGYTVKAACDGILQAVGLEAP